MGNLDWPTEILSPLGVKREGGFKQAQVSAEIRISAQLLTYESVSLPVR